MKEKEEHATRRKAKAVRPQGGGLAASPFIEKENLIEVQLMDLLIENGRIIDPSREMDQVGNVFLSDGCVAACGPGVRPGSEGQSVRRYDASGKLVFPGLIDMHTHLREPGFEYKEDIASGTAAAVCGGFTAVACMPNTEPANDCRAVTELILRSAAKAGMARVYPVGAMTKGRQGKQLAEMAEMAEAGAVAVSDDGSCVANAGLMRRVMEYARTFDLLAIQHCEDAELSRGASMNEGPSSTRAGLPSQPGACESIMVARDIILCRLTGARYHVAHVSTAESVELVRRAKAEGLPVTAEATLHHLTYTDELCLSYDTNTKVNPPLRSRSDRDALRKALLDGTIDALVSDHAPHASTEKALEYDLASFGIIGLQTSLPLGLKMVEEGVVTLMQLVRLMTTGPASVLGLPLGTLKPESPADVTVVDPGAEWTVGPETIVSKSYNTPLLGQKVKGKAVLTVVQGRIVHEAEPSR